MFLPHQTVIATRYFLGSRFDELRAVLPGRAVEHER